MSATDRPAFLSDEVARAKRRREVIRVFAITCVVCLVFGLREKDPAAGTLRMVGIEGIPLGFMILFVRRIVPRISFNSFAAVVLFRAIVYTALFLAMTALSLFATAGGESIWKLAQKHPVFLGAMMILMYVMVVLTLGVRAIARKLGPGVFGNWIRGYYYNPKEEERIFMFLDIRGSTQLAEKLGDMKFSSLVRDFFDDLTGPLTETRASVSHYIGDEAVLTWWPSKGLPEANCLQCFFRMEAIINQRRPHYLQEYGVVPQFKAGAHIGRVVATEVGRLKSEIVFHGDVLNTTARVQAACSQFGVDLLITQALADRLPKLSWLELRPIGDVALKGKSEEIALYAASVVGK